MKEVKAMTKEQDIILSVSIRDTYDVIVCGGGPAGFSAALASARCGAKTAIIESMGFLGGAATVNYVGIFTFGHHDKERIILAGIFEEVFDELQRRDAIIPNKRHGWEPFNIEEYKDVLDDFLVNANVDIYTESTLVASKVTNGRIDLVVLNSLIGNYALKGGMFVDATGDAQLSCLSGAPCSIGRSPDGAIQPYTMMFYVGGVDYKQLDSTGRRGYWLDEKGRGFISANGFGDYIQKAIDDGIINMPKKTIGSMFSMPWLPGVVGINFGRVFGDPSFDPKRNAADTRLGRKQVHEAVNFLKCYLPGFENCYLLSTAPKIGRRESRRIKGLYTLNENDIRGLRQFDDVIAQYCYPMDIHGPADSGHEFQKLKSGAHYDVPYRILVPESIDNLLAAGRCVSATHEALGAVRLQGISMATGQAAGTAAALCIQQNRSPGNLDIKLLQETLRNNHAVLE
jgi:hypothetical protein